MLVNVGNHPYIWPQVSAMFGLVKYYIIQPDIMQAHTKRLGFSERLLGVPQPPARPLGLIITFPGHVFSSVFSSDFP